MRKLNFIRLVHGSKTKQKNEEKTLFLNGIISRRRQSHFFFQEKLDLQVFFPSFQYLLYYILCELPDHTI